MVLLDFFLPCDRLCPYEHPSKNLELECLLFEGLSKQTVVGGAEDDEQGEVECSLSDRTHFWLDEDADGRGVANDWIWSCAVLDRATKFDVRYESLCEFEVSEGVMEALAE